MPSKRVLEASTGKKINEPREDKANRTLSPDSFIPEDPEVVALQRDMRDAFDALLLGTPFRHGNLLTVTFTSGAGLTQEVEHKLGGEAKGAWPVDVVTSVSGDISIFRETVSSFDAGGGARAKTHVRLRATQACVAKIWVWR